MSLAKLSGYPMRSLKQEESRCGQDAIYRTRNILIPFYFIHHPPLSRGECHEASPRRTPLLSLANDHLRRLRQRHHHLLVLPPPLTHPISLALSPAITGQLAQYISTYLRWRASVRSYR